MHWKKSIAAQKDKNYIMIVRSNIRQELYYYDSAFKYDNVSNNVARDEDGNNGDAQVNETVLKTYLVCRYLCKALMNILL